MQNGALFYKALAVKPGINVSDDFMLCTVHRAENTDNQARLKTIFAALNEIGKEKHIVLPLHPRTKKDIEVLVIDTERLTLIEPVSYLEMVWLINHCGLLMTDSGGLQKEAFFFKKTCITLRDETEWVELVDNQCNVLVGADKERIINAYGKKICYLVITLIWTCMTAVRQVKILLLRY